MDNEYEETKSKILEVIKKDNPKSTKELVALVQKSKSLSESQIIEILVELENNDLLHFEKDAIVSSPKELKYHLLSANARWYWLFIAISVATVLAYFVIPEDNFPIAYIRSVLGVVFVFLPGFAFIKALYPVTNPIKTSSEDIDTIIRVALSIGVSLALLPMAALVLNYTPWGITFVSLSFSLLVLTFAFASVAIFREHKTAPM